jgi:hypothetical protein
MPVRTRNKFYQPSKSMSDNMMKHSISIDDENSYGSESRGGGGGDQYYADLSSNDDIDSFENSDDKMNNNNNNEVLKV